MNKINFSGFNWILKEGSKLPPGSNNFSAQNIFIDEQGLHLKITNSGSHWICSEIYTEDFAKWGEYTFFISTNVEKLDKNIVAGLFIYQDDQHELDVEFHNGIASYTIQPNDTKKFKLNLQGDYSTHKIYFDKNISDFKSIHGHHENHIQNQINKWQTLKGNRLEPRKSHLHINFWLKNGQPPVNNKNAELIIKNIIFKPNS